MAKKKDEEKKRYYVVEVTEYVGDEKEGDVVFDYEYEADEDEDIHHACKHALMIAWHGCADGDGEDEEEDD